jgi:hypothetical protein
MERRAEIRKRVLEQKELELRTAYQEDAEETIRYDSSQREVGRHKG